MRDYDKNPIEIRNSYLLKREIVVCIIFLLVFTFFIFLAVSQIDASVKAKQRV
ncbi:MAG: hypothetical protein LBP54_03245 [Campylobacteraceae bacterium]|nr:hypothetical protein [Campylobacteraceae bacterium]